MHIGCQKLKQFLFFETIFVIILIVRKIGFITCTGPTPPLPAALNCAPEKRRGTGWAMRAAMPHYWCVCVKLWKRKHQNYYFHLINFWWNIRLKLALKNKSAFEKRTRARDALGEAGCDASQKHHSVLASYRVVMLLWYYMKINDNYLDRLAYPLLNFNFCPNHSVVLNHFIQCRGWFYDVQCNMENQNEWLTNKMCDVYNGMVFLRESPKNKFSFAGKL